MLVATERRRSRRRCAQRHADDDRRGRAVRPGPAPPAPRPHQPRRHPGYLCVFATPQTDEAQERLDAFTKTSDGFELAEIDFQLRGPGDLFGTRQHGLPPLRIADLVRDVAIVEEARRDAQALIASDPELANPAFARLRRMVFHRYGEALDLGDVG